MVENFRLLTLDKALHNLVEQTLAEVQKAREQEVEDPEPLHVSAGCLFGGPCCDRGPTRSIATRWWLATTSPPGTPSSRSSRAFRGCT